MYLLVWLWIDCPQTIGDNSGHAKKWKNQCLFVWLVYYEMCYMLMQWWFRTNMWCSFLSLWFGSGLGHGLSIIDGQLIHDELKCQSMTVHFITIALWYCCDQFIYDERKNQSVTVHFAQTNVWRGIHDVFRDRHHELTVTHFLLFMTKINRHV
jgi:hypothetical protein